MVTSLLNCWRLVLRRFSERRLIKTEGMLQVVGKHGDLLVASEWASRAEHGETDDGADSLF